MSRRRVDIAFLLAGCFAAGYLTIELAIWYVLFYGFGYPIDTDNNLWNSDRFFFSYIIEAFLAAVGAATIAIVFALFPVHSSRLKIVPLCLFAAGLGGIKTSIPWICSNCLGLFRSEWAAFVLAIFLPLIAGFVLVRAARFQSDRSSDIEHLV